jgi:hypothetical protein
MGKTPEYFAEFFPLVFTILGMASLLLALFLFTRME